MHALWRGDALQKLRLGSGLVLFAFAATHFLNHALGLIGLDVMLEVQQWRVAVTRSIPGTIILAGALLIHISLALHKLATRSTLRMRGWEAAQLGLGLAVPFLLLPHIVNTRIASTVYGVHDTYVYELVRLWPDSALSQSLLLLLVWIHGCIGLHFWLRLSPWYRQWAIPLLALAIFVPLAGLGGFMAGGRAMAQVIQDPALFSAIKTQTNWPSDAVAAVIAGLRTLARVEYAVAVAVALAYFGLVRLVRSRGPKVSVSYIGGPTVVVPAGATLLEISRQARVPHSSICGGRGRCSTCRVRIERGSHPLPPPLRHERITLASIRAPGNVRLACQIRPAGNLIVSKLLRPGRTTPASADIAEANSHGAELSLAVMFVDMRDFTKLSENRLPFDVVFILNEFFDVVGRAIGDRGGRIDKFLGDGLLAIFGESDGLDAGCRQALAAARDIDIALDRVNVELANELGRVNDGERPRSLRVGIGIDCGSLVVGRIGYGEMSDMTVIGQPVNIASRLESLSKELGVQVVVSRKVAEKAKWTPPDDAGMLITVRGVAAPVSVITIRQGRDLPGDVDPAMAQLRLSSKGNTDQRPS